jgi:hypothetical protein
MFAGRRDFSTTHPLLRWLLMRVAGLAEGDWRNWDQITAWADAVATHLTAAYATRPQRGAA